MIWIAIHPQFDHEMLGYIPQIILDDDLRPAREQINDRYSHGGGWQPESKFRMSVNGDLHYPGDPPLPMLAEAKLRDETIRYYQYSFIAIIQSDGSYEVARMD